MTEPSAVPDLTPTGATGGRAASDGAAGGSTPLPEPVVVDITAPIQPETVVLTPWATAPTGEQRFAGPAAGMAPTVVPERPPVPEASPAPGGDAGPTGERPRTERRDRRRQGHRKVLAAIVIVAALLLATAGWAGAQRINHPLARPAVQSGMPATLPVPGAGPSLPWPAKGQGAIAIPALSYTQQSGPESPVPIASLTKMTNALVVLRDHPVPAGASGPSITITPDDVAEYDTELHNDQSTVPIHTGEVLTELQMLEALLTQSANDAAYSLAMWDTGSIPAFVAKMNALAASLGTTGHPLCRRQRLRPRFGVDGCGRAAGGRRGHGRPHLCLRGGHVVHRLPRGGHGPQRRE